MMRTFLAITAGLMLCVTITGCGGGGEDAVESTRREPPAEKRTAPGADIGSPQASEEEPGTGTEGGE